jgi:pimeloyl-ACP methyl ester carboxylesterase
MPTFEHDGLTFHYRDEGAGLPFVFQHGLGGDVSQPFGLYKPPPGVRLIAFDCRAHGATRPVGDVHKVSMATFADDLVALLDRLDITRAVVGGISMGAAVALGVALRYPERLLGLVLSRPGWIDRPLPDNTRVFVHIARHILHHGARDGLVLFRGTPEYRAILDEAPECAASLEAQFTQPRAEECVTRLERIPFDSPCHDREELASIDVPTLVLGNRQDPIHPWDFARSLTGLIPDAALAELTPKSRSVERHAADVQRAIDEFLGRGFL